MNTLAAAMFKCKHNSTPSSWLNLQNRMPCWVYFIKQVHNKCPFDLSHTVSPKQCLKGIENKALFMARCNQQQGMTNCRKHTNAMQQHSKKFTFAGPLKHILLLLHRLWQGSQQQMDTMNWKQTCKRLFYIIYLFIALITYIYLLLSLQSCPHWQLKKIVAKRI